MHKTITKEEEETFLFFGEDVLNEAIKNVERYNRIYDSLIKDEFVFKKGDEFYREGFVHPDSSGLYKYQFSYFDKKGPMGDLKRNTLMEMADLLAEEGYVPILEKDVRLLNDLELIANFIIPNTGCSLIKEREYK